MKPLAVEGLSSASRKKSRSTAAPKNRRSQEAILISPHKDPLAIEHSAPQDTPFQGPVKMTTLIDGSRQNCFNWAEQTLAHPSMKNIHEFRRSIRKFKTYLWLLPLPQEHACLESIHSCLRKTHRLLGRHRTLEIALQDAKKYDLPTEILEKKLKEQHKKLLRKLPVIKGQDWALVMAVPLENLGPFTIHDCLEKISRASDRLLRDACSPPKKNPARHKLRLRVKKMSIFLQTVNSPQGALVELQKALGRWHDLLSLEHLAQKGLGPAMDHPTAQKSLDKVRKDRKAAWRRAKKILGELVSQQDFLKDNRFTEQLPPLIH